MEEPSTALIRGSSNSRYRTSIQPSKKNRYCACLKRNKFIVGGAAVLIGILLFLIGYAIMKASGEDSDKYNSDCNLQFEETQLLRLDNNYTAKTTEILENFINSAKNKIDVVGLLPSETDKHRNREAERIFEGLIKKAEANVSISINVNSYETANDDLKSILNKIRYTKNVNFTIVKEKLQQTVFIFDDTNMYFSVAPIGQITTSRKESCIIFSNCSCIVKQVKKLLLEIFPNMTQQPLNVCCKDENAADFNLVTSFPTSSDQVISPEKAFTRVGSQANEFIYIAANEYDPYFTNLSNRVYWPLIDNQLRSAASNNVTIRILTSKTHNKNPYWESLNTLPGFEVKQLIIPSNSIEVNLNQDRYMVTESGLYYGMPRLSGDGFINSIAIGFVLEDTSNQTNTYKKLLQTIVESFEQHWNRSLAKPL